MQSRDQNIHPHGKSTIPRCIPRLQIQVTALFGNLRDGGPTAGPNSGRRDSRMQLPRSEPVTEAAGLDYGLSQDDPVSIGKEDA